jgi:hypothetical protein
MAQVEDETTYDTIDISHGNKNKKTKNQSRSKTQNLS